MIKVSEITISEFIDNSLILDIFLLISVIKGLFGTAIPSLLFANKELLVDEPLNEFKIRVFGEFKFLLESTNSIEFAEVLLVLEYLK